jgi:hypothetical protein
LFGDNSTGWRVPAAIAGRCAWRYLIRVTRRMTRSTLLGAAAGILLAADGSSIVQSRFRAARHFPGRFVLAGFGCLVVDRDRMRDRLAAVGPYGGRSGSAAGGWPAACCWAVLRGEVERDLVPARLRAAPSVLWDRRQALGGRRAAAVGGTALRDLPGAVGSFALAPVAAYLLSWSGWFLGRNSYDRHWAYTHTGYWSWLPGRSGRC